MIKYFLLGPRRSGKTTKAISIYRESPNDTLFVSPNKQSSNDVCHKCHGLPSSFISSKIFEGNAMGLIHYRNIIFDEYCFYEHKEKILCSVQIVDPQKIFIFSTPNYDQSMFDFVKHYKPHMSTRGMISLFKLERGIPENNQTIVDIQILDLYYSFLTDDDILPFKQTKIIFGR